jgi:hypothetical protein
LKISAGAGLSEDISAGSDADGNNKIGVEEGIFILQTIAELR